MQKSHRNAMIIVIVLIAVVIGYKMVNGSPDPVDDVVVTSIPVSGYSIEDDNADGIPDAIPADLPAAGPLSIDSTGLPSTLEPVNEPVPASELVQTKTDTLTKEGFTEFAPRRWSGELL